MKTLIHRSGLLLTLLSVGVSVPAFAQVTVEQTYNSPSVLVPFGQCELRLECHDREHGCSGSRHGRNGRHPWSLGRHERRVYLSEP
jgi:hypothetical protein